MISKSWWLLIGSLCRNFAHTDTDRHLTDKIHCGCKCTTSWGRNNVTSVSIPTLLTSSHFMVTPLLTLIEMHSAQPPKHPRRDEREEWEMDGPLKGRGPLVAGGCTLPWQWSCYCIIQHYTIMHTDMTPHIATLALIMKPSISDRPKIPGLRWGWWAGCWVVVLSLLSHYPWSLVLVWHQPLLPGTRGASLAQINNIFIAESFWRDPKKIKYLHPCSVTHRGAIV